MNPRIEVNVIGEYGIEPAMFGMGLSFGLCSGMGFNNFVNNRVDIQERMMTVFEHNASKDGGHNKFLESMQIWLDVNAPRYWWSEADTYRIGSTKQSESTMHTLVKQLEKLNPVSQNFHADVQAFVNRQFEVNDYNMELLCNVVGDVCVKMRTIGDPVEKLLFVKGMLPEAFMQRRIWNINYKTLRNIDLQRHNHRLPHWEYFLGAVMDRVRYPEFLKLEMKMYGGLNLDKEQ